MSFLRSLRLFFQPSAATEAERIANWTPPKALPPSPMPEWSGITLTNEETIEMAAEIKTLRAGFRAAKEQ